VLDAGRGLALADWTRLERDPDLCARFRHLVVIDPAPFAHLDRLADRALGERGFLHLAWGDPEVEMSLWVHRAQWPRAQELRGSYADLVGAGAETGLAAPDLREALAGGGAHPRAPEPAARCVRVLSEAGVVALDQSSGAGADLLPEMLRVVSSGQADLERSAAYAAYGRRLEEGETYLRKRRAPS
jgi:hypothetical protein